MERTALAPLPAEIRRYAIFWLLVVILALALLARFMLETNFGISHFRRASLYAKTILSSIGEDSLVLAIDTLQSSAARWNHCVGQGSKQQGKEGE